MPIGSGGGGGGATAVVTRQQLVGNAVVIANGGSDRLTWDTSFGPNVLLDRTTLGLPAVIASGVYAVAVFVAPNGNMTVGGLYEAKLELDFDSEDATIFADSPTITATNLVPNVALTMAYYIAAGGTIRVLVTNLDGVAARGFFLTAVVQRVS